MTLNVPRIRNMQSKFVLDKPGDNLTNDHLAMTIVYIINEFAKEKPYLFPERNFEGKYGPKFKNELQEFYWDYMSLQL